MLVVCLGTRKRPEVVCEYNTLQFVMSRGEFSKQTEVTGCAKPYFTPMLPDELLILAPTTYSKLNLLNFCQHILAFKRDSLGLLPKPHSDLLSSKRESVKQVISRIVATDNLIASSDKNSE